MILVYEEGKKLRGDFLQLVELLSTKSVEFKPHYACFINRIKSGLAQKLRRKARQCILNFRGNMDLTKNKSNNALRLGNIGLQLYFGAGNKRIIRFIIVKTVMSQPTDTQRRFELLDIFRGFAVFGILMVNFEIMNCTFINQGAFGEQWTSGTDQFSVRIFQLFFYTKFFPIFSFLFGVGISMQALKQIEQNNAFSFFFARRMAMLFLFGVLHILFLWSGDVLHLYAIFGFFTPLLLKRSNKVIIALSVILLLFPFYDQIFGWIFTSLHFYPESFLEAFSTQEITRILRSGTYLEGMHFRLLEYISNIPVLVLFFAPLSLSMFLLGLYAGKNNLISSISSVVNKIKKPAIAIAVITNIYRIAFLFFLPGTELYKSFRPYFIKLMVVSDVAMGLFYLWLIAWIFGYTNWKKVLNPLKFVGRMALTNYIMHSFIGLILFSSLGFQLYETLSPTALLLTVPVIFCFQIVFSKIWLSYFYFGPLEWVWRCFSYRKLLPLKKGAVLNKAYGALGGKGM